MARARKNTDDRPLIQRTAHLKPRDRIRMEDDMKKCHKLLADDGPFKVSKRLVSNRLQRLDKSFHDQAAPEIDGDKRTENARRIKELEEKILPDGMLSPEEMRCRPGGAADLHVKWMRKHSGHVQELRNLKIENEPENTDKSYLSIERLRGKVQTTMSMHDALLPSRVAVGGIGSSPAYAANYEATFGNDDERAKQNKEMDDMRELLAQQSARIDALTAKKSRSAPAS